MQTDDLNAVAYPENLMPGYETGFASGLLAGARVCENFVVTPLSAGTTLRPRRGSLSHDGEIYGRALRAAADSAPPIPMVLHCPACKFQHIDKADEMDPHPTPEKDAAHWTNPPHKTHRCGACGHEWRPCALPTNGVEKLS